MTLSSNDRERCLKLIRDLRDPSSRDSEADARLSELERLLRFPRVTDLLFYRDPELTDEEVLDEAQSYQPLV